MNENNNNRESCAAAIKAALARRGMTQRELAERMEQHPVALNATIRNANIKLGTLQSIADAIGCDVAEFFAQPQGVTCPVCGARLDVELRHSAVPDTDNDE